MICSPRPHVEHSFIPFFQCFLFIVLFSPERVYIPLSLSSLSQFSSFLFSTHLIFSVYVSNASHCSSGTRAQLYIFNVLRS